MQAARMLMRVVPFLAVLNACEQPDETVTAYAKHDGPYQLATMNGEIFSATATIDLRVTGTVSGHGPCNAYRTSQTAPYPWIELGPITATRRGCPDLDAEAAFLEILGKMTIVEASNEILILSNDARDRMVFHALP